ncbi:hypothetical protein VTO73DRAFT_14130 [Trametes versicolor]
MARILLGDGDKHGPAPAPAPAPGGPPSEHWLRYPAWIDGARHPPRFYASLDEINIDRIAAGYPPLPPYVEPPPLPHHPVQPPAVHPAHPPPAAVQLVAAAQPPVAPHVDIHPPAHPAEHEAAGGAPQAPDVPVVVPVVAGAPSGEPVAVAAEPIDFPLHSDGHLVSVTLVYSSTVPVTGSRASRGATKKMKEKAVKSDHIQVQGASRVDFIHAALAVHDLAEQYCAGATTGPPVKIWWPGSSGGKSGASTVDTDHDFEVTKAAILRKNKDNCTVNIEFDLDGMDGYRLRKRPIPPVLALRDAEEELHRGDKVPRLELFSEEAQINGQIIMQLKAKWTCERHSGEHGEAGFCYVDEAGVHLGLNNRKLKIWAAAISAADATKHQPPATVDFDGLRDGRMNTNRPRGRPPAASSSSTSSSDLTALLMAAVIPLITSQLVPKVPPAPVASISTPSTPKRAHRPLPPFPPSPQSPAPVPGTELHTCLADFLAAKGIDLGGAEAALADLELTPDIINEVPVARLCDILGAVEGRVRKFQLFCKEWVARVEDKKRRGL